MCSFTRYITTLPFLYLELYLHTNKRKISSNLPQSLAIPNNISRTSTNGTSNRPRHRSHRPARGECHHFPPLPITFHPNPRANTQSHLQHLSPALQKSPNPPHPRRSQFPLSNILSNRSCGQRFLRHCAWKTRLRGKPSCNTH